MLNRPGIADRASVIQHLCGAIAAASAVNFRPTNKWLWETWETILKATETPTQYARGYMYSCIARENADLPSCTIQAAYTTAIVWGFSCSYLEMTVALEKSVQLSQGADNVLKWMALGCVLKGASWENVKERFCIKHEVPCFRNQVYEQLPDLDPELLCIAVPYLCKLVAQFVDSSLIDSEYKMVVDAVCNVKGALAGPDARSCSLAWRLLSGLAGSAAFTKQQAVHWEPCIEYLLRNLCSSGTGEALTAMQLADVYFRLASSEVLGHIPVTSGLLDVLLHRMRQQQLAAVGYYVGTVLIPDRRRPILAVDKLADVVIAATPALPEMSINQLAAFVCSVERLTRSSQVQQMLGRPIPDNNSSTGETGSTSSSSTGCSTLPAELADLLHAIYAKLPGQLADNILAGKHRPTVKRQAGIASHMASILYSLRQISAMVPATTAPALHQFCQHVPEQLVTTSAAKLELAGSNELAAVMMFLSHHQIMNGKTAGSFLSSRLRNAAAAAATASSAAPIADTSNSSIQSSITVDASGSHRDMSGVYCVGSRNAKKTEQLAAAAAAALKMSGSGRLQGDTPALLPADPTAAACALCDMAQALGASSLPVEAAVMDVLAGHVHKFIAQFSAQQLPILLWAFARKPPSSVAAGVMEELLLMAKQTMASSAEDGALADKERAVCDWAAVVLKSAGLVQ